VLGGSSQAQAASAASISTSILLLGSLNSAAESSGYLITFSTSSSGSIAVASIPATKASVASLFGSVIVPPTDGAVIIPAAIKASVASLFGSVIVPPPDGAAMAPALSKTTYVE
jgi:hypothetical protein